MLAMWLISRKQAGKDPPAALTPDMMPPTMRPKGQDAVSTLDQGPLITDGRNSCKWIGPTVGLSID